MIQTREPVLTAAGFGYQFGVLASSIPVMPALSEGRLVILNPDANFRLANQRSMISFDASASTAERMHEGISLSGVRQRYDMFVREARELQSLMDRNLTKELDSDFARWVESSGAAGVALRNSRSVPAEIAELSIRQIARIMARKRDPELAGHAWTLGLAFTRLAEKAPLWQGDPIVYASDYFFQAAALFAMLTDDRALVAASDRFSRSANLLLEQSSPVRAAMAGDAALDTAGRLLGAPKGDLLSGAAVAGMWQAAAKSLENMDPKGFVISVSRGLSRACACDSAPMVESLLGAAAVFYSGRGLFPEAASSYVRLAAINMLDGRMGSESWSAVSACLSLAEEQAGKAGEGEQPFRAGQIRWLHQQAQRLAAGSRLSVVEGVSVSPDA